MKHNHWIADAVAHSMTINMRGWGAACTHSTAAANKRTARLLYWQKTMQRRLQRNSCTEKRSAPTTAVWTGSPAHCIKQVQCISPAHHHARAQYRQQPSSATPSNNDGCPPGMDASFTVQHSRAQSQSNHTAARRPEPPPLGPWSCSVCHTSCCHLHPEGSGSEAWQPYSHCAHIEKPCAPGSGPQLPSVPGSRGHKLASEEATPVGPHRAPRLTSLR